MTEREFVIKWDDEKCKSLFLNLGILVGTVEHDSDAEAHFGYDSDGIPISVELR